MPRTPISILSAVTLVAALGFSGCSGAAPGPAPPAKVSTFDTSRPPAPAADPLPAPDVLTGVVYQLADGSVPAEEKVGLVQYATASDQPALTNFGEALEASGFEPLTVQATDLRWAGDPGHVTATVTIASSNATVSPFTYPMEFSPLRDSWQLSRRTADQLLPLVGMVPPRR